MKQDDFSLAHCQGSKQELSGGVGQSGFPVGQVTFHFHLGPSKLCTN